MRFWKPLEIQSCTYIYTYTCVYNHAVVNVFMATVPNNLIHKLLVSFFLKKTFINAMPIYLLQTTK